MLSLEPSFCQKHQDSLMMHTLIMHVKEQMNQGSFHGIYGTYPVYINRKRKFSSKTRDFTIFYNELIDLILRKAYENVSIQDKKIIEQLLSASKAQYIKFANRHGRDTYNFWRKDSSYKIPYRSWVLLFNKSPLVPDDFDDTAMGYWSLLKSKDAADSLHALMSHFSNNAPKKSNRIPKTYREYKAYSTWFGKKFPTILDVCVLANTLSFVQHYQLSWNQTDSCSLKMLLKMIDNNDIEKHPAMLSPNYVTTSLILYHLSKLMNILSIKELEQRKRLLIQKAQDQLQKSQDPIEKILLYTSLLRWGCLPEMEDSIFNINHLNTIEYSNYAFFIGNMASVFPCSTRKILEKIPGFIYHYYCPAFNDALLLELLLEKESYRS